MTTQQLSINEVSQPVSESMNLADSAGASNPESRKKLAGLLLTIALLAALVVAGWGVLSSLGNQDEVPARIGESVAVEGGAMSVDSITPESMAPMKTSKFSAGGMSMPGAGMDMAPEGQRRFTAEVTLAADDARSLSYSPDDFQVSGNGLEPVAPIRDQLEAGSLSAGSAVAGTLLFQVPEEAKGLMLDFDGGQPVALDLKPADGNHSQTGHSHGHN